MPTLIKTLTSRREFGLALVPLTLLSAIAQTPMFFSQNTSSGTSGPNLVSHGGWGVQNGNTITGSSINTTGANLIIAATTEYINGLTLTDIYGNTYTPLTARDTAVPTRHRLWYCVAPTTGASHTWNWTAVPSNGGYVSICVQAWSGMAVSPYDSHENGSAASSTTIQPGSITPSAGGTRLVVCSVSTDNNNSPTFTIDSSLTITDQVTASGFYRGTALAYVTQVSGTAINPTYTASVTNPMAAAIASFKGV